MNPIFAAAFALTTAFGLGHVALQAKPAKPAKVEQHHEARDARLKSLHLPEAHEARLQAKLEKRAAHEEKHADVKARVAAKKEALRPLKASVDAKKAESRAAKKAEHVQKHLKSKDHPKSLPAPFIDE